MKYNSKAKSMKTLKEVNFDVNDFWKDNNTAVEQKHRAMAPKVFRLHNIFFDQLCNDGANVC